MCFHLEDLFVESKYHSSWWLHHLFAKDSLLVESGMLCQKRNVTPRKINGWNLRIHPWKGTSSSKPSFSGSILIFRGVTKNQVVHGTPSKHLFVCAILEVWSTGTGTLSKPGLYQQQKKRSCLLNQPLMKQKTRQAYHFLVDMAIDIGSNQTTHRGTPIPPFVETLGMIHCDMFFKYRLKNMMKFIQLMT